MAVTADSSSNRHSPREAVNSPQFRGQNLPSPWVQVVRRPESISGVNRSPSSPSSSSSSPPADFVAEKSAFADSSSSKSSPPPMSETPDNHVTVDGSDSNSNNAGGRPKKAAWNKPSNGVMEVSPLGAMSWPALSESARASTRSSADGSSRNVSDGSASTSQGPANSHSAHRQAPTNANPNSMPNRTMAGTSGRQRNSRRGGSGGGNSSGGGSMQGGFTHTHPSQPPLPPPRRPFPVMPMPANPYSGFYPVMHDPSLQEPQYRPTGGFVPQPQVGNDPRHSARRGSYGRGDGSYQNSFGRRNQDRGNYGNTRDAHIQPQRSQPRGLVRPPPLSAPSFIPPQPVRPFGNPTAYPEIIFLPPMPFDTFRGAPYIAPPSAMLVHPPEHFLRAMLVHQIDYYFSDANLVKDDFLKSNMDEQGWVPISLIAGFPRVKYWTSDIRFILDSLRSSTIVEVQGVKVRRRDDWMKWISSSSHVSSDLGSPSQSGSSVENLTASLNKITVEEKAIDSHTEYSSGTHLSELTGHSRLSNGESSQDMGSNRQ
ncbi:hypothetical protein SLEP1_g28272 [Rubroshorea leprosula]|uniref:HTH La-type RNA-binding domain-containing protein n=2 Tax=Rubroshorea leprosula TaxID=152421 RepID=A0AAV5K088_9ROSI|nr:hypothetical protein SLEP1_g28272 [Rubroshorea leprosula]